MPLTEEERNKIIEEERIRADERAKYAQAQPQPIVVKEKRKTSGCTSFLVLIIILGILSALVLLALGNAREKAQTAEEQAQSTLQAPVTEAAFDVPSLIGKNLTEVRKMLGTPTVDDSEPNAKQRDFTVWDKTWEKDGFHLTVTYNPQTLRITDFFISLGGETTADTDKLLKIGNLSKNDLHYKIEFVSCRNCAVPNQYTGVKAIPK